MAATAAGTLAVIAAYDSRRADSEVGSTTRCHSVTTHSTARATRLVRRGVREEADEGEGERGHSLVASAGVDKPRTCGNGDGDDCEDDEDERDGEEGEEEDEDGGVSCEGWGGVVRRLFQSSDHYFIKRF